MTDRDRKNLAAQVYGFRAGVLRQYADSSALGAIAGTRFLRTRNVEQLSNFPLPN